MKKKAISLMLALAMTITSAAAASFNDVSGHWAERSISAAAGAGVVSGYTDGGFHPNANITRAEFATMLSRVFNWSDAAENTYVDLPEGAWYEATLLRAASAGVMTGDGDCIRPTDLITRQEAAVCIARSLRLWQTTAEADYEDYDDIADWAKTSVSALKLFGIMSGRGDGMFAPRDNLTRAEAATLVAKLLYPSGSLPDEELPPEPTPEPSPGPARLPNDGVTVEPELPNNYITFQGRYVEILKDLPRSSKTAADFSAADGRISYPGAQLGVDVSAWQGDIDWEAVAADGVSFAMIRAGFRGYTAGNLNVDSYFEKNLREAKAAGLQVGVYFYSQAITPEEAREEARLTVELLGGETLDLPIVYDWELPESKNARTRKLARSTLTACAEAFCEEVERAGYDPMVYFYMSLGYEEYKLDRIADYPFWLAQYSSAPTFYYDFDMWQFTDKGRVNGIEGGVDMDLMFVK